MFRLLITHGHEEWVFAVPEKEARLGRAKENDIALRIPGVSRWHALVRRWAGGVEVLDLDSKNKLLVEGKPVARAVLTPGLRLQIGEAWLEVEEVTTTEEALACVNEDSSEQSARPAPLTAAAEPQGIPKSLLPEDVALTLAYHIAQVGVGIPKKREDLLLRIKSALGADAFVTLERTRSGRLRIWESVGTFPRAEERLFTSLAGDVEITAREQMMLKRAGVVLLAGRDSWFLAARFPEESMGQEKWRKEFLRFLASEFFPSVRSLHDVGHDEASRILSLVGNNKKRASRLLGISRTTLYELLELFGLSKRKG
jgi:hypothetical protein